MKISLHIKLTRILLALLFPVTVCAQSGSPVLKAGTANISGEVIVPPSLKKDSIRVILLIPEPFAGGGREYNTLLGADGRFALKVNLQTDLSICAVRTDINRYHTVTAFLRSDRENRISLSYGEDGMINTLSSSENPGVTEADLLNNVTRVYDMHNHKSDKPRKALYDKPYSIFIEHINNVLEDRRPLMDRSPALSDKMKEIAFREFLLPMYYGYAFDYEATMIQNYGHMHNNEKPGTAVIKKPVRQDFSFLKALDLNNPLYLYCYAYPMFTQELLRNSTVNIPRIKDTPISEWIKHVKDSMADLLGFDRGIYYDMLISNAYAMQLEAEVQPLTDRQLQNIRKYYKGGAIQELLFRKNQEVIEQARLKDALIVNKTPNASPEALMNEIVARYKGKIVVVDFWATWCTPCLQAMHTARDLKKQLAGKDVVFVYITNPTSPKKLWESHIKGIGGEQYYLTTFQWRHLMDKFGFTGIPSYLMFDKQGTLKKQFTSYPGNEAMLKWIENIKGGN